MNNLFYFYLCMIAIQDARTYYFSKVWFIPSILIGICWIRTYGVSLSNLWCSLYFVIPSYIAYRKKGMGSADVWFIGFFSFLLGWERMIVALFISVGAGLFFFIIKKERLVPFVSCLALGVGIAFWKGYTIYSHIFLHLVSRLISTQIISWLIG